MFCSGMYLPYPMYLFEQELKCTLFFMIFVYDVQMMNSRKKKLLYINKENEVFYLLLLEVHAIPMMS